MLVTNIDKCFRFLVVDIRWSKSEFAKSFNKAIIWHIYAREWKILSIASTGRFFTIF